MRVSLWTEGGTVEPCSVENGYQPNPMQPIKLFKTAMRFDNTLLVQKNSSSCESKTVEYWLYYQVETDAVQRKIQFFKGLYSPRLTTTFTTSWLGHTTTSKSVCVVNALRGRGTIKRSPTSLSVSPGICMSRQILMGGIYFWTFWMYVDTRD